MTTMISSHEGGADQQEICDNPALAFLGQGRYPLKNKTKQNLVVFVGLFCFAKHTPSLFPFLPLHAVASSLSYLFIYILGLKTE